jgi:transcriptional regulator with XRE-family HTH domain
MLMDENRASMERQGSSLKYKPVQYTDPRMVFTRSQAEIAKRLGVSPQEYARAMSKVTK